MDGIPEAKKLMADMVKWTEAENVIVYGNASLNMLRMTRFHVHTHMELTVDTLV